MRIPLVLIQLMPTAVTLLNGRFQIGIASLINPNRINRALFLYHDVDLRYNE